MPKFGASSLLSPRLTLSSQRHDSLETKSTLPIISKSAKDDPLKPVFTPAQPNMISSLNSIPKLKKVRAYSPYIRKAHSMIIVRDPKTFEVHKDGMVMLMHWADRFVL